MVKNLHRLTLPALVFASLMLFGCLPADAVSPRQDFVSATGTVTFLEFEGGFYGILSDDGGRYKPMNLQEEFQVSGLRVRFEARLRRDVVGFHMWGSVVEILKIERLD